MESGLLDQRIDIYEYKEIKNEETGELDGKPVFYFSCFAHQVEHTLRETKETSGQGTEETTLTANETFEIRREWDSKLKIANAYELHSKGSQYRIISYSYSYDKILLECRAIL